ncbi:hypothetical protein EAF04_007960 [Stromatinia cepivora]|nr:hypothetical protein EAF04_007960 [Stromatinia cepivora]
MMFSKSLLIFALAPLSLATTIQHPSSPLSWDVFHAPEVPVFDLPHNYTFLPTSYTLLHGQLTAVLIDAPVNIETTLALADWISEIIGNKTLTYVYITHGHGDHFFGIPVPQQRFPGVATVATERTIAHVAEQLSYAEFVEFWSASFHNQIPTQNETIQPLPSDGKFYLEEHLLRPLKAEWIRAIDKIESLQPKIVVPSHKQIWDGYGTDHFEKTRQYIKDWANLIEVATTAKDLEEKITALYPQRVGDWILEISIDEVNPNQNCLKGRELFPAPMM